MESNVRPKILSTNFCTNETPFLFCFIFFYWLGNKVASAAVANFVSRGCNIEELSFFRH